MWIDNSLLFVDGFELDCFVGVLTTTSRASAVQVLFDVMPAETADLNTKSQRTALGKDRTTRVECVIRRRPPGIRKGRA